MFLLYTFTPDQWAAAMLGGLISVAIERLFRVVEGGWSSAQRAEARGLVSVLTAATWWWFTRGLLVATVLLVVGMVAGFLLSWAVTKLASGGTSRESTDRDLLADRAHRAVRHEGLQVENAAATTPGGVS